MQQKDRRIRLMNEVLKLYKIMTDIFIYLIATDCTFQSKSAVAIPLSLGDELEITCPPNYCAGQYIIEHLNHSTSQYELVQQGYHRATVIIATLHDAGYFRCSKRCNDSKLDSLYCYLNVVGMYV